MPHFFINAKNIKNKIATISDDENYNHIARALHAKIGETILLVDENEIQYEGTINEISSSQIKVSVAKSYKSFRRLNLNLSLAQAVLKKEAQINVIKKASELGVKGIYPLFTENCTVKKSFISEKIEKYNKLSKEASKQCERPDFAVVYPSMNLSEILNLSEFRIKIVCVEKYSTQTLKNCLRGLTVNPEDKILLIIGCEGGFTESEFSLIKSKNIPMVSLGNLILRADTAVITALSDIIYELADD